LMSLIIGREVSKESWVPIFSSGWRPSKYWAG